MQLGTHLGISPKLWGNEGMLMVVAEFSQSSPYVP